MRRAAAAAAGRGLGRLRRRGSALVIAVLLVLLLAIIGTAFVTTTSSDRVSAYQNADNTQIDLFLDGVIDMVRSTLVTDLFGGEYTAGRNTLMPADAMYEHQTSHYTSRRKWLGSRVPVYYTGSNAAQGSATPFDGFTWPAVTMMPHLDYEQNATGSYTNFVSPLTNKPGLWWVWNAKVMSIDRDGVDHPAFKATSQGVLEPMVVADADGDGVGDSPYWPLTYQPRNGVTYLAGVRIVDNCAAINVNTAWSREHDFENAGQKNDNEGRYRSGVGLLELLRDAAGGGGGSDIDSINRYRFGDMSEAALDAYDDNGTKRQDFKWDSQGDALWANLGARMGNPGWNGGGNNRYRPFSTVDDGALAYRFLLINPEITRSPIEDAAFNSVYAGAPNYNADPQKVWKEFGRLKDANGKPTESHVNFVNRWFANFDYDAGGYSARPLLVANNAVSRHVQAHRVFDANDKKRESPRPINPGMLAFKSKGDWQADKQYKLHDIVRYQNRHYASRHTMNGTRPSGTDKADQNWDYQPWDATPQKTSLNTGTFRDLWRSYWLVMAMGHNGSAHNLYTWWKGGDGEAKWSIRRPAQLEMSNEHADPIRPLSGDADPVPLEPTEFSQEMLQLRSALAAVNTLGMRDQRTDVVSRTIRLYRPYDETASQTIKGKPNRPPDSQKADSTHNPDDPERYGRVFYEANVFSHEWQPVISEVLVDKGHAPDGYVAVELFNPYPQRIGLWNWHVGLILRDSKGYVTGIENLGELSKAGATEITPQAPPQDPNAPPDPKAATAGMIVLENTDERPKDVTEALGGTQPVKVPGLKKLLTAAGARHELVLLRPRKGTGELTASSDPINVYNEGTQGSPNLIDFVPVEQFDFGGIAAAPGAQGTRYRYARNTSDAGKWEFYFPGYFNPTDPQTPRYYEGLVELTKAPGDGGAAPAEYAGGLGRRDNATYQRTLKLKLHDAQWPGNHRLGGAQNRAPFGMFARVGDALRVPLIGSYTIRTTLGKTVDMTSIVMDAAYCDADSTRTTQGKPVLVRSGLGRFLPDITVGRNFDTDRDEIKFSQGYWLNVVDHFCIRKPEEDFLPNVLKEEYGYYKSGDRSQDPTAPDIWVPRTPDDPVPVANTDPSRANVDEPPVGEQGLINVNTAPWKVLAQLPLVHRNGKIDNARTVECAQQLQLNEQGVFKLRPNHRRVLDIAQRLANYHVDDPYQVDLQNWEPLLEPAMRVSNLVTVRSDSFTVYVVVEGWRDCYTSQAKKVLQRRVAFIADRSGVTETNRELRITNVPIE